MQDNQAKHRQLAKQRVKIERKKTGRGEAGTALLVCEGECTEPFYLKRLLQHLAINAASVEIMPGQSKSDAMAVINRARQRFEQDPRDRVFVVIDGDKPELVAKALRLCKTPLQRANRKKRLPEIRIEPILSNPCFEMWLLLHFQYCDQPFRSFADVLVELKGYLPDYKKCEPHIFDHVGANEGLSRALSNAPKLRRSLKQTGASSPYTDMDLLVEALRAITTRN